MHKLRQKDIAPLRLLLAKSQYNKCSICNREFKGKVKPALDHDHYTGQVRGVLCLSCNRMEGKCKNASVAVKGRPYYLGLLKRLITYLDYHETPRVTKDGKVIVHNTHKSDDEKRLKRNKQARDRNAKKKAKL